MKKHPSKDGQAASFLPLSQEAMRCRGIEQLDVILVTGDAYVDHPAFGAAIVGRYLESLGLSVGIIAMPDVKKPDDFTKLGVPRYFFGITSGNVDSMVSLFTAQKKIRSDDPYVPGGTAGLRPARAIIAYSNAIRRAFKNVPIVIGGIEASLRRIAHYDYWSDTLRQSIALDAKADLLVYGMAERPLTQLVAGLKQGKPLAAMTDIPGTVVRLGKNDLDSPGFDEKNFVRLPSFEEVCASKQSFSAMTKLFYQRMDACLLQQSGSVAVAVNPPATPLTIDEMDALYELPFAYAPHPSYTQAIPAWEQIQDSFVVVRGCFGGCNFCGLGAHQGRAIQSRSRESVRREVGRRSRLAQWKGIVSDLGGPTANMYGLYCKRAAGLAQCKRRSCLAPEPCPHVYTDQSEFAALIDAIGAMEEVKHVYVNSGIRTDLALLWPGIIEILARKAVGGRISIAPEHVSPDVLKRMNKPVRTGWEEFERLFIAASERANKKQFVIPYLIAGHPGGSIENARRLGDYLKKRNIRAEQVQEFMPLPMTVSASMYYTGLDPFTGETVPVSHKLGETRRQKDLIMWWK